MGKRGLIEKYKKHLPVTDKTPIISLQEGATPLLRAERLSKHLGLDAEIYLKVEGLNPTGSFKDRGMTMAVSKAVEDGSPAVICASTGNTAASAAAYAAKAGIRCAVLLPENAIALGKLAQAITYGAQVIGVKGNFDDALELVKAMTEKHPITLVNSLNPYRIEGQKTAAFEVCDYLGCAPDYLAIPVGNAGNITAYWRGFKEYHDLGVIHSLPQMLGFQAAGAAPIVQGTPVTNPETIATAIRIGNPASWKQALQARDDSQGCIEAVTDDEILQAYRLLASTEGVFAEPASAASIAGVISLAKRGHFSPGCRIVCVLTGNGLKDADTAMRVGAKPKVIPVDFGAAEKEILGQ